MRAGARDRYLQLQSPAEPTNGDATTATWTTVANVWGEKLDAKGIERFVGQQRAAQATQAYRVLYLPDIDPTWRVLDGSEAWKITGTPEGDGRREETLILVERMNPRDVE